MSPKKHDRRKKAIAIRFTKGNVRKSDIEESKDIFALK